MASTFFILDTMDHAPAVYIVASAFLGTIYTGVTSQLVQQHRNARYNVDCRTKSF